MVGCRYWREWVQYRTLRHSVGGLSRIRKGGMDIDEGMSVGDVWSEPAKGYVGNSYCRESICKYGVVDCIESRR